MAVGSEIGAGTLELQFLPFSEVYTRALIVPRMHTNLYDQNPTNSILPFSKM